MSCGFVESIEHFAPHSYTGEQGGGLFLSHFHNADEITLVLEGEGYYTSPGQNVSVASGDLILIPAGIYHGFVCLKAWAGISLHYNFGEIPAYCQYLLRQAYKQSPNQIIKSRLCGTHLHRAKAALLQLEEEVQRGELNEYSDDLMRNALETLLLSHHSFTLKSSESVHTDGEKDERMVQEVLQEIHRTYFTSLKIADLAARRYLSESIFRKKFTERVGVPPKQYIITLRLNEAKRLLRNTYKPVEFIATEVGFTSSSRFHESFIKYTGMTPLEWRKNSDAK